MSQIIARDLPYSTALETGRYALELPFSNYPTPDILTRKIIRSYRVTHDGYSPSITNLTTATNLALQSQALTVSPWSSPINAAIIDNSLIAPDGTLTAAKLTEDNSSSSQHYISQINVSVSNQQYTLSIFAKSNNRMMIFRFDDASVTGSFAGFDLIRGIVVNGSISGATETTAAISYLKSSGYYRCTITFKPSAGIGSIKIYMSREGLTYDYNGDGNSSLYLWGGSLIAGPNPGPYITTTTTSRTVTCPDVDAVVNNNSEDADPLAYQCRESGPVAMLTGLLAFSKTYCRIPPQFISPGSFIFTAPNYPLISIPYITTPAGYAVPSGAVNLIGNYLVNAFSFVSGTLGSPPDSTIITGYFDVALGVTSFTGAVGSETSMVVSAHNYIANDRIIFNHSGAVLTALVTSVSGTTVNVGSVISYSSATAMPNTITLAAMPTSSTVRKRTRSTPHVGQVLMLPARNIEAYYLPGVTPGISTFTDITEQPGFNISDFLAAYANANNGSGIISNSFKAVKFTGHNGIGNATATGMLAGDTIKIIYNITDDTDATSYFDTTLLNLIHQSNAIDLSAKSLVAIVTTTGNGSWFNVQSNPLTPWLGSILVQKYVQCRLSDV